MTLASAFLKCNLVLYSLQMSLSDSGRVQLVSNGVWHMESDGDNIVQPPGPGMNYCAKYAKKTWLHCKQV